MRNRYVTTCNRYVTRCNRDLPRESATGGGRGGRGRRGELSTARRISPSRAHHGGQGGGGARAEGACVGAGHRAKRAAVRAGRASMEGAQLRTWSIAATAAAFTSPSSTATAVGGAAIVGAGAVGTAKPGATAATGVSFDWSDRASAACGQRAASAWWAAGETRALYGPRAPQHERPRGSQLTRYAPARRPSTAPPSLHTCNSASSSASPARAPSSGGEGGGEGGGEASAAPPLEVRRRELSSMTFSTS